MVMHHLNSQEYAHFGVILCLKSKLQTVPILKVLKFWIMYVPAPLDCSGENTEFRDSKCMQSENGKEHTTGKHTGWVVLRSYPQDTYNYRSSKHSMTDGYVHYVILDTLYMLEDIHYVCLKTFPQQALPSTKRQYYY